MYTYTLDNYKSSVYVVLFCFFGYSVYLESDLPLEMVASFHRKKRKLAADEDADDEEDDDFDEEEAKEKAPIKKSI